MAGALFIVGMGPGGAQGMTFEADAALRSCDVIVGYTAYARLLEGRYPEAELRSTGMTRELERCRTAFEEAEEGKTVAIACSGDSGVYGMASPVLELSEEHPGVDVEVVPGATAAQTGAALLGAPLGHDYAVVSLSDLLTPWETIERRLEAAAWGDFCLCLYNPRSSKRPGHLARAAQVLMRRASGATVCGWARNVGRDGEAWGLTTLQELGSLEADMFTTVFVGNSQTKVVRGRMVTPRGYGGTR